MNIQKQRPWITPLVMGAFLLSAVTGVLMFFHLESGLNKPVHEWLSWLLLAGVALHALLNLQAFKRYFAQRTARWVIGLCAVILALSFMPLGGRSAEPGFAAPVTALANVPLPVLAQVVGVSTPDLVQKLLRIGLTPVNEQQSLRDLVGPELRAQLNALRKILPPPAAQSSHR